MTELAPSSPGNKSLIQTLGKEHSRRKTRPCKVCVQHVWTVKEQKKAAEPESKGWGRGDEPRELLKNSLVYPNCLCSY